MLSIFFPPFPSLLETYFKCAVSIVYSLTPSWSIFPHIFTYKGYFLFALDAITANTNANKRQILQDVQYIFFFGGAGGRKKKNEVL